MYNGFFCEGSPRRIVVVGDIHGDFGLLLLLLKDCAQVIDARGQWIPNNRTYVVIVGDTLDRQRPGLKSVGEVYGEELFIHLFLNNLQRQARDNGGRLFKLLGNHEEMNMMEDYTFVTKMGKNLRKMLPLQPGTLFSRILYSKQDTYAFIQIGPYFFIHGGLGGLTKRDVMRFPLCNDAAKNWFRNDKANKTSLRVVTSMLWDRDYTLNNHCNQNRLKKIFQYIGNLSGEIPTMVFSGHSVTWENAAPDSQPFDRVLSQNHNTTTFGLTTKTTVIKEGSSIGINLSCDKCVGRVDNGASRGMGEEIMESRLPQVLVIDRHGYDRPDILTVVRHNTGLLHQKHKCLHPEINVKAIANILRQELEHIQTFGA